MKFLLHIIFLCSWATAFCQQDALNVMDSLGRKQGHWIFFGKDRPDTGIPADGKVEEGNYIDDRKEGLWIKYHDDGKTPKIKGEYENNRPKGPYSKIGSSNNLRESGNFTKNKYTDSLKRYFDNGQLEYEAWYNEDGKEEGRVNFYHPNGQLEFTYIAKNGVPTETQHYDINGNSVNGTSFTYNNPSDKEPITYAQDSEQTEKQNPSLVPMVKLPHISDTPNTRGVTFKAEGYNKVYNEDDEIWLDGQFVNGQLSNGKHYVYDRDGILLKVQIFKNGAYHSDGQL